VAFSLSNEDAIMIYSYVPFAIASRYGLIATIVAASGSRWVATARGGAWRRGGRICDHEHSLRRRAADLPPEGRKYCSGLSWKGR